VSDRDLISAYLDGVAELTSDERKRIAELVRDEPEAAAEAAAVRAMIGELRALPHEGREPEWSVLEREIRRAVGPQVPNGWLRAWGWLIPVGALVTGAVIVLLLAHPDREVVSAPAPIAERAHVAALPPGEGPPAGEAIWLDGEAVELGDVAPSFSNEDAGDDTSEALADESGLLPATNLDWIDDLDERALERAEAWLDHKKGHEKG
jgi:hypothetical protein